MKRFGTIIALIIMANLTLFSGVASADPWWDGNSKSSASAIEAVITLPSSELTMYSGLVAGWVSTGGGISAWAQTGWVIVYGYAPWSYTEYQFSGGSHELDYKSQLSYGDASEYEVRYDDGYWKTYIDDAFQDGWSGGGLPTPPCQMLAYAEVQGSSSNELWAHFSDVWYYNPTYGWYLLDQANWRQDYPYYVAYQYYYNYYTLGN